MAKDLETTVMHLKKIDSIITQLRKKMRHSTPYSVDTIRQIVAEIEGIREDLLKSELESDLNLQKLLEKKKVCTGSCIRQYTGKQEILGYPTINQS
ncbi:hypothetical protein [Bacillus horti]|uniref:PpGpp synthetase/RelA/SpoT-type nucleotidyltransferase n=1 Tax=Caldalkalibacillus horti TaxID=77523 RepID=A0ABT9VWI3_9BACI|nr:hypothetical protein [Bacillus horti]MDQ0165167.1 ppGpp synthetase/RelA/SpoT-type nucleotidyltransferase [Bacillus horti]